MSAEPAAASGPDSDDPIGARYPNTARIWNYQLGGKDNKPLRDAQDSDGDGGTVLKPASPQSLADNRGMGWRWAGVGIKN